MAKLRKCKDCGNDVSRKAGAYPNCGAPVKKRGNFGCLSVFVIVALAGWLIDSIYLGGEQSRTPRNQPDSKPPATTEEPSRKYRSNREMFESDPARAFAWMERDKERIERILQDAESARFDDVYVSFYKDAPVTCGRVNAKNSFGAYAGFKDFLAADSINLNVVRGDGQMTETEFVKTWNLVCMDRLR